MPFRQRELKGLFAVRSLLILAMTTLSWLLTMIVIGPRWSLLSTAEHLCIIIAPILLAAAFILRRYTWGLWLPAVAMAALGATALVPSGSLVWTYPQTYFGYVGFICSMLLPRRFGLATCFLIPFGVWLIWQFDPQNVVPEAFSVANGWILLPRMLGSQLLLWWMWWWLRGQADLMDRQLDALRLTQVEALARQERSQIWRVTAERVHATMLNSINALLPSRTFDPSALRSLADQGRTALEEPVPLAVRPPSPSERILPVNAGVVLITGALGGALLGGSLYVLFVGFSSLLPGVIATLCTFIGCLAALVIVLRRARIPRSWATLLVLVPAAVPWVLASFPHACSDIGAVSATASITGFAIVCIGLWSGLVPSAVGLIAWAAGAVLVSRSAPAECSLAPTVIVLNVATFLPLVVIIAIFGGRLTRRSLRRLEEFELESAVAASRSAAIEGVEAEMSASVREAADIFDELADRGAITDPEDTALRCLASRMRASIQIDPASTAGLSLSAYEIAVQLAHEQIPIEVGVLAASPDQREVPQEIRELLLLIGRRSMGGSLRLQCLNSQRLDFLSLTAPLAAVRAAGCEPGTVTSVGDLTVTVQDADPNAEPGTPIAVMVEREVAAELLPAH